MSTARVKKKSGTISKSAKDGTPNRQFILPSTML